MTKPQRVQYSRKHKLVSPNDLPVVYVGRPTKWGNPFKVGSNENDYHYLPTIEKVLQVYEIATTVKIGQGWLNISELHGKNLACWCPLDKPCHADILLKLANPE